VSHLHWHRGLGFLLTFSKTILCLLAGLVAAAYVTRRRDDLGRPALPFLATVAAVLLLAAAYSLLSHFVILSESADRAELEREMFVSEPPLARFSLGSRRYVVLRTSYFFVRRTRLIAMERTWPFGVGP
jgi:hypothetical protein